MLFKLKKAVHDYCCSKKVSLEPHLEQGVEVGGGYPPAHGVDTFLKNKKSNGGFSCNLDRNFFAVKGYLRTSQKEIWIIFGILIVCQFQSVATGAAAFYPLPPTLLRNMIIIKEI